jgi:hypothetical protein
MTTKPDDEWSESMPWIGQYILDESGNPVPAKGLFSWGKWMQENDCRIAFTQVANAHISTVFLGLDHAHHYYSRVPDQTTPILYETMVFGGTNDRLQRRYATREDALEGHRQIVQMHTN